MADDMTYALACRHVIVYARATWCTCGSVVSASLVITHPLMGLSQPHSPLYYLYAKISLLSLMWDYAYFYSM